MSNADPKYIPFPLFLIGGLPNNLNEIFDYGIFNFAMRLQPAGLGVVYTQVLYAFYRQKLPSTIKKKLDGLIRKKLLTPDEDYNGFDGAEFHPDDQVAELLQAGKSDPGFVDECIRFWKVRQAMSVLRITGSIESIIQSAQEIQVLVDQRASRHKNDVTVMISINMMFEYYKHAKTDYEIELLRGFLAIKSILGNSPLAGTTKAFIATRMLGAKSKLVLEETLQNADLKAFFNKYSKRYHIDKLLEELLARGFIKGKLAFKRRIYLSTHHTTKELPELIHQLLLKNNSKIKRDKNKEIEKQARAHLNQLIGSGATAA